MYLYNTVLKFVTHFIQISKENFGFNPSKRDEYIHSSVMMAKFQFLLALYSTFIQYKGNVASDNED